MKRLCTTQGDFAVCMVKIRLFIYAEFIILKDPGLLIKP